MENNVNAWVEEVIIPTYAIGEPEKNPLFLERRVYQGSSGVVYPHPVIEKIADEKTDKAYQAVFIENEYLKIMVLPEIGGRIQRAYDKVKKRDFIYYNQVIKPALVGLTGPWISGGIEFNWPQHHRPSTYQPVDFTIEENSDGSKTVWINEVEIMFRTKGMAGFTLYPDKAYVEIKGKVYNRTMFPQTFLWWSNPAVKVNEHYQSVFPPDVTAVFDHGRRDVSDFPIATGTYYKVNYAPGTDISKYKNIPVPTSYMAVQSDYDFIGCYEHDTQAGMMHVADHHTSPGKKQWTWGNGEFGYAWDRNLTDEDGPYIELMTGLFTDNQPDFSWINPNEEKTFEQYFMPYSTIGVVKNATKEAMVNMELLNDRLSIKVYATAAYKNAEIVVLLKDECFQSFRANISPALIFEQELALPAGVKESELEAIIKNNDGTVLVSYKPAGSINKEMPPAATAIKKPAEIDSVEQLFLSGLHLEQYRHATFNPVDYYREALRREPTDSRCNNAMGLLLLRRGQFKLAESYLRTAVNTLIGRNPNPYDGEAYYNLGCSLVLQNRLYEAYNAFYKATWNDAQQHSGFLALAKISASKSLYGEALQHIEKSIIKNYHSHTARHLKVVLLRKTGQIISAIDLIDESVKIDPFNYGCLFERYLILSDQGKKTGALITMELLKKLMHGAVHNYLEYALDYANAGFYAEATALLDFYIKGNTNVHPMVYYYLGYFACKNGDDEAGLEWFKTAAQQSPDYVFPNKIDEVNILQTAATHNPADYKVWYYLGNFWYDKRQYNEAIECWEKCVAIEHSFATVHRNLALAYYNKLGKKNEALKELEIAAALNPADARILMELDQLYKTQNYPIKTRLNLLENRVAIANQRDDLYLERITLYNNLGNYAKAYELIMNRKFHPWEGGEGRVVNQFLISCSELAKVALKGGAYEKALAWLNLTAVYPHNLGEGKLYGAQENDLIYLKACALHGLGFDTDAAYWFKQATIGISEPVQAIFYNDPQPDKIFYQGLAWLKLNEEKMANAIFNKLITFGQQHRDDHIEIDYFAVSLPDIMVFDQDLDLKNHIHCHYLVALGQLGLKNYAKANELFGKILTLDVNHQGAMIHKNMIDFLTSDKLGA